MRSKRVCATRSSDYPVRPRQHIRRNREADLLGSSEIDEQLELHSLLYRKLICLGTLENFVHENGRTKKSIGVVRRIRNQCAFFDKAASLAHQRKPSLYSEIGNRFSVLVYYSIRD